MQNYLKCSPRWLFIPTSEYACAGAVVAMALAAQPLACLSPSGRPVRDATRHAAALVDRALRRASLPGYSIRLVTGAGGPCIACGADTGTGAVGHCGDSALCDRCLLEQCEPLGMLLALAAVTRAYATAEPDSPDTARESLVELGGFARIFEQVVGKWGPARLITSDGPGDG